jgi:hypothetical protein
MKHKGKATKAGFKMILWTFAPWQWFGPWVLMLPVLPHRDNGVGRLLSCSLFWWYSPFLYLSSASFGAGACGNQPGCLRLMPKWMLLSDDRAEFKGNAAYLHVSSVLDVLFRTGR